MTTTQPAQLITACSWYHRVMVEAGYEETTLIGYNGTAWVKSK